MALSVKGMERVFSMRRNGTGIQLPDPNPDFTPDEVMSYYSNLYPELTTSTVHGPVFKDDTVQYEFRTVIGRKG